MMIYIDFYMGWTGLLCPSMHTMIVVKASTDYYHLECVSEFNATRLCKLPTNLSFCECSKQICKRHTSIVWRTKLLTPKTSHLKFKLKLILCYFIEDDEWQIVCSWQKWWRIVEENADSRSFSWPINNTMLVSSVSDQSWIEIEYPMVPGSLLLPSISLEFYKSSHILFKMNADDPYSLFGSFDSLAKAIVPFTFLSWITDD